MSSTEHCQPAQLIACLADEVSDDDRVRIESHLADCPSCQLALESQAATQEIWDSTLEFLPDDEHDRWRLSGEAETNAGCGFQELIESLAPTDDPRMLGRLGPFEIAGIIGAGGMGIVLKGFDPSLSRFVAVKVLAPQLWSDANARERFSREARAAASIVHDNVIEIYGVAEVDGIPYFTMPYLRGETLQQRIELRGPLAIEEVLRISKQLADALAAAHSQGLVHRDIKPANILLTEGCERVRLSDFGLAHVENDHRLTQTGAITGTPRYMSPEQVEGVVMDQRSDLFSLGTVIYEMCTAQSPFAAESIVKQMIAITEADPIPVEEVNPAVPIWLAAIIDRLHARAAEDRYESAELLSEDLQQCLANVQNPVSCTQPRRVVKLAERYQKMRRRRQRSPMLKWISMTVATLGIASLLMGAGAMMMAMANGPVTVSGRVVDPQGNPIADSPVLAIKKTWPGGRYRQQALETTTDSRGRFEFPEFADRGKKYQFLLTAMPENYTMASLYKAVDDGSQQRSIDLKVVPCKPTRFQLKGSDDKPLAGAVVLPTGRISASGQEHMVYAMHLDKVGKKTDADGKVVFSGFLPGETAEISIRYQDQYFEKKVKVHRSQNVVLRLEATSQPVALADGSSDGAVVDKQGKPIAGAKVLIIHKSWPGGRYQQRALETKTDAEGEFQFPSEVSPTIQNAFLVTILANGYEMKSSYRVFKQGNSITPFDFQLSPVKTLILQFVDEAGNPLAGSPVTISSRKAGDAEHIIYAQSRAGATWRTNGEGKVSMGVLSPGDEAEFMVLANGQPTSVTAKIGSELVQRIVVKKKLN